MYKLLSKVLANRLRVVLDSLILESQDSFVWWKTNFGLSAYCKRVPRQ